MQPFSAMSFLGMALLLFGSAVRPAHATSYSFSFYGTGPDPFVPTITDTLSGTGTFASNTSPVFNPLHLSDLTSFSLTTTFGVSHGPGSALWDFGLGDLTGFTYETAGNPGLAPLFSLTTNFIDSSQGNIYPSSLVITGVLMDDVSLYRSPGATSSAQATITAIGAAPEPGTFWLLAALGMPFLALKSTQLKTFWFR
jgi:hypothetical protein